MQGAAAELQHHATVFPQSGSAVSGHWLAAFQAGDGAWQLCAELLHCGAQRNGRNEFLDAFCAQTLATHARALPTRCHGMCEKQVFHREVEQLLAMHLPPRGHAVVWRQLALALVCSEIWLGTWSPSAVLAAQG